MAVAAFDRAVFVRYAAIIAGRDHAIMRNQRFVAARLILLGVALKIAKRRRQAVGAMLTRCAAQNLERVL